MTSETVGPADPARRPGTGPADANRKTADPTVPAEPRAQSRDEMAARAKRQAVEVARDVKDRARSLATGQKSRVADRMGGLADALRTGAHRLDEKGDRGTARYVEQAGDSIAWLSDELRDRDVDDLVAVTRDFARQRPAAFFGGALVAGFFLARFMKSTAATDDDGPSGSQGRPSAATAEPAAPVGGLV